MKLEEIVERLHALVDELKSNYIEKLQNTAEELLADFDGNNEGVEKIKQITDEAVKSFQNDLEKVLVTFEEKFKRAKQSTDKNLERAGEEATKSIRTGFSKIFEEIYGKLKGLFNRD